VTEHLGVAAGAGVPARVAGGAMALQTRNAPGSPAAPPASIAAKCQHLQARRPAARAMLSGLRSFLPAGGAPACVTRQRVCALRVFDGVPPRARL
jgi:hypothetical protein